ncbi:MAG: hypothetical protein MHM6MM_003765 [Cercozoa sp. M6MM]
MSSSQELTPSDHGFWARVWHRPHEPQWKEGEVTKPFASHLSYLVSHTEATLEQFASQTVLVPLCGDTEALDFLSTVFAKVIGVEFTDKAVNIVRERFLQQGFAVVSDTVNEDESERVLTMQKDGKLLEMQRRDFFLPNRIEPKSVHCVYDRASLVAIEPSRREEYGARMQEVCAPNAVYFVITVERGRNPEYGPPHHVPKEVVESTLAAFEIKAERVEPTERTPSMVENVWTHKHYVLCKEA